MCLIQLCEATYLVVNSTRSSHACVLIPLYVCPHTYMCVLILHLVVNSTRSSHSCVLILLLYLSSYSYICVLIFLYVCPHTTMCVLILCVSSYYYICVLILLYVSAYYYTCGLILLHVSSYSCLCQRGPLSRGVRAQAASSSCDYISSVLIQLYLCVKEATFRGVRARAASSIVATINPASSYSCICLCQRGRLSRGVRARFPRKGASAVGSDW
jgi:hypothetical protein